MRVFDALLVFGDLREPVGGVYDGLMFKTLLPPIYRRLRKLTGLTQTQMGVHLGISRGTLSRVESGKSRLTLEQEESCSKLPAAPVKSLSSCSVSS